MFLTAPDLEPGRCLNHRAVKDAYGFPTSVRCLDYEGHDGKCQFPPAPKQVRHDDGAFMVYQQPQPKPWVSPLNESDSGRNPASPDHG